MAIPKKGSRLIVVDGVQYRWRVRGRPTYDQGNAWSGLNLAVESAEIKSGQVLVVDLERNHPSNWITSENTAPVLPSDVERTIRQALTAGWKPNQPGKQFLMSAGE